MVRRGLIIAAGWVGAVVASTVLGVFSISTLGGAGKSGPLSQRQVSDRLAHTSPGPDGTPTGAATSPAASANTARRYFTTSGGSLWASCTAGLATLDTVTPRSGYRLDGWERGPASSAWVQFKVDVEHGHGAEYRVTITCQDGVPNMVETADD
jgi:hypothetical protein